jgi:hypothetical protein
VNWAERGVGPPSAFPSLEQYARDSQAYHAQLLRISAEHLRTRKFERCCGAFAFHLVDPFSSIGFGVFDHAMHPKPIVRDALADAFRATRVIVDPLTVAPDRPAGAVHRPDRAFTARLVVVNDDPHVSGSGLVRWSLTRERGIAVRGVDRLRDAAQRKSFTGSTQCEVPTAFEPAVHAGTVSVDLRAEGEYRLEATLSIAGEEVDHTDFSFTVAASADATRLRPELPAYLAARLADLESLRAEKDGLSFVLDNHTRPAVLTSLAGLRLDGRTLARHDIQVEAHSGRAPLPRRLDLPLGRRTRVFVVTGEPLADGLHSLEADVSVAGVGSGRLVIEGTISHQP